LAKPLQPCWFNFEPMESPTVGSTSVNHRLPMQTFAQRSMLVVTPRVQPKMVGRTVMDGLCCSSPCPAVPATRPLGPSCANGWPPPTLALPAPITRSDPVVVALRKHFLNRLDFQSCRVLQLPVTSTVTLALIADCRWLAKQASTNRLMQ
jgi:hypothetical protein